MWLFVPEQYCPSARGSADLTWGSNSLYETLTRFVTLKESYLRPQSWLTVCKRVVWIRRLCGLILPPLTAARGIKEFISSLQEYPASRGHAPGKRKVFMTIGGYGRTFTESFARLTRRSSSLKTSQALSVAASRESLPTWPRWGMMRNGVCFRREKLERLISVKGFLLSPLWNTPTVFDSKIRFHSKMGGCLINQAGFWVMSRGKTYLRRDLVKIRNGTKRSLPSLGLNPRFVERMIGLPKWWVCPAKKVGWRNFVAWEIRSSRLLRDLLLEYWAAELG